MVNHKHKIIYTAIPKTGTTSLVRTEPLNVIFDNSFFQLGDGCQKEKHQTLLQDIEEIKNIYRLTESDNADLSHILKHKYYSFTVVRNPLYRLVSEFLYRFQRRHNVKMVESYSLESIKNVFSIYVNFLYDLYKSNPEWFYPLNSNFKGKENIRSHPNILKYSMPYTLPSVIPQDNKEYKINELMHIRYHLCSQSTFVDSGIIKHNYNHIGRVEDLQSTWYELCRHILGERSLKNNSLPKLNSSVVQKNYLDFYSSSDKQIVKEIYYKDFKNFNYNLDE
jgi:hypothetical protein|tara:strand:- start:32356 stop:33192 length:837 start_codon:yes stop_codon:yes gene_type:complete